MNTSSIEPSERHLKCAKEVSQAMYWMTAGCSPDPKSIAAILAQHFPEQKAGKVGYQLQTWIGDGWEDIGSMRATSDGMRDTQELLSGRSRIVRRDITETVLEEQP